MVIELLPYDLRWPMLAAVASRELKEALPTVWLAIEHIGSTSVPGLTAKPVIDLMGAVVHLETVLSQEDVLADMGYRRMGTGMPGRLFYRRQAQGRLREHLHVVPVQTWQSRNERLLRDHLRAHPEDAARYVDVKRALADAAPDDYTRGKTAVIQDIVDRARAARGLPLVPVWEE